MHSSVWTFLYWFLRPLIKWFLRKTTKLCELQRICYGEKAGAARSLGVEFSLTNSKNEDIKALLNYLNLETNKKRFRAPRKNDVIQYSLLTVARVKEINLHIHIQFIKSFSNCVEQIWGYRELVQEIESVRTTQYSSEIPEHEVLLLKLWKLLMPDVTLESRVTKQWQDIGFQGDDPKTDFRGMGLLGLQNLLYFAEEYPSAARYVLSHSHHPQYGYAFAIVGINLTSMAYNLMIDGSARTHMYNTCKTSPSMKLFHQFYCFLFYEFDRFWIEAKPKNVMDFTHIKERFVKVIRSMLVSKDTVFRINISVDDV